MKPPPKILRWLLDQFCPSNRPDIKGDFLELYDYRVEASGRFKANVKFLFDSATVVPLKFIIKEKLNATRPMFMLTTYLKIAGRNLVKNKLNSAINLIGLSVSLTACILITLFIKDELSFDKHFQDRDRIFRIAGNYHSDGGGKQGSANTSYLLQPMLVENLSGIDQITRIDFQSAMVTINGNKQYMESEIIYADSTFFTIFSLIFIRGNHLSALNDPNSVVLDQLTAQKYFGEENAIGKSIDVKGKVFIVTGVIKEFPPHSHFTGRIILPMSGVVQWYQDWVLNNLTGRRHYTYIKVNNNFDQAEFESSLNKLITTYWPGDVAPNLFLQPIASIHLKSDLQGEIRTNGSETTVFTFAITAIVILLLAGINYINLTLASSLQRSKEVGIKKVLGSSTLMQMSQFQIESFLVVIISVLLAILFTKLSIPMFNQLSGKLFEFNLLLDPIMGIGILLIIIMVGLLAGGFPAFILLRMRTINMLSGKLQLKTSNFHFRNMLIVFQFSISIALIASTLLVMDQINFIRNKNLGIDPEQLVIIPFQTSEISQRYEVLKAEILLNPSVLAVSGSNNKVTKEVSTWRPYVTNWTKEDVSIPSVTVAHDFFETMGAQILEGRSFSQEYQTDVTSAYVLNEAAVKLLGLKDPVGQGLFGFTFTGSKWFEKNAHIIGVVKDFHFASLHVSVQPTVFSLASDKTEALDWMEVRIASNNIRETIESLESKWAKHAPERPFQFEFMNDELQRHYQAEDRFMKIFSTFSMLSILLGGMGLFGLTAFMTKRRTKEIGIRKIMGASTRKLVHILSIDFLKLVITANLIGWPIAYYFMNNWLQHFAYQITISSWIFLCTGFAVVMIAFLAILYHSLKVSRANPIEALRYE